MSRRVTDAEPLAGGPGIVGQMFDALSRKFTSGRGRGAQRTKKSELRKAQAAVARVEAANRKPAQLVQATGLRGRSGIRTGTASFQTHRVEVRPGQRTRDGRRVQLRPEEMPVLVCDR